MKTYVNYSSPIGELYIVSEKGEIIALHLGKEEFLSIEAESELLFDEDRPELKQAVKQLAEYFSGERKTFDLELKLEGTLFQKAVWNQLQGIPFGKTRSYQEIAIAIGNEKAVRAIGQANKANKLPILIPCHRVIGKNKSMTGYAGTRTDIKEQLLSLEGALFKY